MLNPVIEYMHKTVKRSASKHKSKKQRKRIKNRGGK